VFSAAAAAAADAAVVIVAGDKARTVAVALVLSDCVAAPSSMRANQQLRVDFNGSQQTARTSRGPWLRAVNDRPSHH